MLDLPEPDRSQLANSPLDLVVCQIRFDERRDLSEPAVGFAFQEALGADADGGDWQIEPVSAPPPMTITVTPDGTQQTSTGEPVSGWRFTAPDGAYAVMLMPDSVAVETQRYAGWDAFRQTVARVMEHLIANHRPEIEYRVGLRYVDRLRRAPAPDGPSGWIDALQPGLHGFVGHEELGATVLNQQHQTIFALGQDAICRFVHGTVPTDDGLQYILDYDLHRQAARRFDPEAILVVLGDFNTLALQLFQASVTPDFAETLR